MFKCIRLKCKKASAVGFNTKLPVLTYAANWISHSFSHHDLVFCVVFIKYLMQNI